VIPGRTGILYPPVGDPVAELLAAVRRLDRATFDPGEIRGQAERFSAKHFITRMRAEVDALVGSTGSRADR
jgi:hypothetical protein